MPNWKVSFLIINYETKEEFKEYREGQYLDSIKTEIYNKYCRKTHKIQMECEREIL